MDQLWSEDLGRVTRAFDEWTLEQRDLREFLALARQFADSGYEALDREWWSRPAGEDDDFVPNWMPPQNYHRLLLSYVLRDGVSLYEVYLEKALEEVWAHQVGNPTVSERSPKAPALREVYQKVLGCEIRPDPIADIIAVRDLLTHRRGELRTEQHQIKYDQRIYMLPDIHLHLGPEGVEEALDRLGANVRLVDRRAWQYTSGRAELDASALDALNAGARWLRETGGSGQ